jgi:hypothetical protein
MIRIRTSMEETTIINLSDQPVPVTFKGREYLVEPGEEKSL